MEVSHTPGGFGDIYSDSIRDVSDAYKAAFEEFPEIHEETIESYEELGGTAVRIGFSNGTVLSVNWGLEPAVGLQPLSYHAAKA
jgi:predicted esterase